MHWYVRCYDENEEWTACVVHSNSPHTAEKIALDWYEDAVYAEAEMFNTFEHGDPNNYEILS